MDGLSEALGRFNKSAEAPENKPDEGKPGSEKSKTGGKGHSYHVHVHKDGSHHLTAHGKDGQLVHHSVHSSMDQAADMMKQVHGEAGTEQDHEPQEA